MKKSEIFWDKVANIYDKKRALRYFMWVTQT